MVMECDGEYWGMWFTQPKHADTMTRQHAWGLVGCLPVQIFGRGSWGPRLRGDGLVGTSPFQGRMLNCLSFCREAVPGGTQKVTRMLPQQSTTLGMELTETTLSCLKGKTTLRGSRGLKNHE